MFVTRMCCRIHVWQSILIKTRSTNSKWIERFVVLYGPTTKAKKTFEILLEKSFIRSQGTNVATGWSAAPSFAVFHLRTHPVTARHRLPSDCANADSRGWSIRQRTWHNLKKEEDESWQRQDGTTARKENERLQRLSGGATKRTSLCSHRMRTSDIEWLFFVLSLATAAQANYE